MKTKILIAIILSSLVGCAPLTVKTGALPLPPELILPKISAEELNCLSDPVFLKLQKRDQLQQERIKTLESIIRSTRE